MYGAEYFLIPALYETIMKPILKNVSKWFIHGCCEQKRVSEMFAVIEKLLLWQQMLTCLILLIDLP